MSENKEVVREKFVLGVAIWNRIVRVTLIEKLTFEQRFNGNELKNSFFLFFFSVPKWKDLEVHWDSFVFFLFLYPILL